MKKVSLFLATAVLTMALASCGGNFKTSATLNNEIDSINYAFGVVCGSQFKQQIKQQVMFEDTAKLESFYKAFLSGFNADFKQMAEGKWQQINGMHSGMDVAMSIKDGFIFGDSAWTAKKELINKFALEVINGKEEVGGFTMQAAQEFYARINREKRDTLVPFEMTPEKLDSLNVVFAIMVSSRYTRELDDIKRVDFAKGFKSGLSVTDEVKKYKVIGSHYAAFGFKFFNEKGLMGDSTITLHPEVLLAGINAGVLDDNKIMTEEIAGQYLEQISMAKRQAEIERQKAEMEEVYGKNKIEGAQFLAENKTRKGVVETESGLQYEVIKQGKGAKPAATDTVTVHYHGTFIDGTVFDSSVDRGQTINFPLNGVIAGWTEGVQLMSVGSKYKFYIPYELAYGDGRGMMEPFKTLIFEVELFEIKKFVPKASIINTDLRIQ